MRGVSTPDGTHRMHAARVALVATLVVLSAYALCAFGLTAYVEQRLTGEVDARLSTMLVSELASVRAHGVPTPSQADSGVDPDDTPVLFWRVRASGDAQALTPGAPPLPRRSWSTAAVTLALPAAPFRVSAERLGSGWLVAGQDIANVGRAVSALALPEMLFGLLLAAATFAGALTVGMRASAPLELVRRRQAEFTADASHELRTPLSVVEAEVDLALRRPRTTAEYEAVLQRIRSEGRTLGRIIEDLLWLARVDDGAYETSVAGQADVDAVAAACVDRFQAVAQQRDVSLTFLANEGPPASVRAAPEWIDRLSGVLIDNACKYAGRGGSVAVSVTSSPHRVVLTVDDTGPGIPPSERSAVFDRFHRATTDEGGSGLGLAIADSVVRMTDGTWSVEDAPLGGARMAVAWRRVGAA